MATVENETEFLCELNSNIIRSILELYRQENARSMILTNTPHFLELASKILLIFPENEEELYNVFMSSEELCQKCCPFTLIQTHLANCKFFFSWAIYLLILLQLSKLIKPLSAFSRASFALNVQNSNAFK